MKIIGLMSGTSADGVDAALLEFDGSGVKARLASHFEPYSVRERELVLGNMGLWQAHNDTLDAIHGAHNRALRALPEADVVGFHGQSLNHDARAGRTFQAGDPGALETGAKVVFDFRTRDVEAGGEGAPLMPIYHYALARELGFEAPVEFVNIGGVSNVSYVDPSLPPEEGLLAFDTGVGNAMSDDLMRYFFDERFDLDGAHALLGVADEVWLERALGHEYFARGVPKSLDRMSLYGNFEALKRMRAEDAIATAMEFAMRGIEQARAHYPTEPERRILMGGGRRNGFVRDRLGAEIIDDFGLDGDMIEAEGFAYLAWAHLQNAPISFPKTTGVAQPLIGGRVRDVA